MTVDWFKWLRHESDFDDLPRIQSGPLPTPVDHPDNWDALDFEADLIELHELARQVEALGPRTEDLDGYDTTVDAYWDWNRRRSIVQFAADTILAGSFEWLEPVSFQELWDAAGGAA